MKIRAAAGPDKTGQTENTFIAVDDLENQMGVCHIEPKLLPELLPGRPCQICISAEGDPSAMLHLLGSALTRAMILARESGENARIYAQCAPDDPDRMELYRTIGFINDDALVRMSRRVISGPNVVRLPEDCVFVMDDLTDLQERTFFLTRQTQLFQRENAVAWLEQITEKPLMKRLLLTSREGLVGELVCWAEKDEGVIGLVYTAPAWRRKGMATYLLEAARQYFYRMRLPESHIDVRLCMIPAMNLAATAGYRQSRTLIQLPGMNLESAVQRGQY